MSERWRHYHVAVNSEPLPKGDGRCLCIKETCSCGATRFVWVEPDGSTSEDVWERNGERA